MTGSLVDRATTDQLIGPDWAMNLEICETLNRDPGLAKDAVKGLRKRIGHKNPKVQLLALTLLETIIKNCGDIVHMHVAERELPQKMAKIVKKKPDFNVKEKILVLIDTWQEAFGGPRARYPQYYAAYQELLRAGAVFPKRPERSAPMFTNLPKHSLSSYSQPSQSSDYQQEAPETSADSDIPALSLAEIQNARGIMDVLSEMLNALDPGNQEGLRQEVVLELVHQCRSYKQRLVHLVNSTSDEDLLCQGLALNDDLQRVLAKYDALAAGVAVRMEKTKSLQALVDIDDPVVTNSDGAQPDKRINCFWFCPSWHSNQLPLQQLLIPGPPPSNGTATPSASVGPHIDLLSGDYDTPAAENSLALVSISEPLADSATEQNALVLSDVFSQSTNNNGNNTSSTPFNSLSEASAAQAYPSSTQPTLYSNGSIPNSGVPPFQQFAYHGVPLNNGNTWNSQVVQGMNLQQPPLGVNDQGLPLPPWETQTDENSQVGGPHTQPMQNGLPGGVMHPQIMQNNQLGATHPEMMQSNQQMGMYPLQMQNSPQSVIVPSQMQNGQLPVTFSQPMQGGLQPGVYPSSPNAQPMLGGHPTGYSGYVQQQPQVHVYDQRPSYPSYMSPNEISQGMHGLYMQDNSGYANASSFYPPYVPKFNKPSKPEDKLFGDLVSMAKIKQNKTSASDAGNL